MKKLWNLIKTKFLTKKFLTFVIIGVMNTIINTVVYRLVILVSDLIAEHYGVIDISTAEAGGAAYYISMGLATLLAFCLASLFSYYANARFTYQQKEKDSKTFLEALIAYVLRFTITYLFTLLIAFIFNLIFKDSYRTIANLCASIIMIPPFFLVLGLIFKRTKTRLSAKEEPDTTEIKEETEE